MFKYFSKVLHEREKMIRFDVFGKLIGVERRSDNRWHPYILGHEGKRRDADFVIPDGISEEELDKYLAELFHESAMPGRCDVKRL